LLSQCLWDRRELASGRAYSPHHPLGAGGVSALGLGAGRDTPILSNTNPSPFFSASSKLIIPASLSSFRAIAAPIDPGVVVQVGFVAKGHDFSRAANAGKYVGALAPGARLFSTCTTTDPGVSALAQESAQHLPQAEHRRSTPLAPRRAPSPGPPEAAAYWHWPAARSPARPAYP